jgi:alpha-tubulin suppressor-like RCC1 family protein
MLSWFVENNIKIREVVTPSDALWSASATFFITEDGKLYACGYNGYGQLGNGTTTNSQTPIRCGNLTGVKQVAVTSSKYMSVYAIDNKGDLWSWGYNAQGRLGLGDQTARHSPTKVTALNKVKQISAIAGDHTNHGDQSDAHALALLEDGTVYATGDNNHGQLGVGDTTDRHSFTLISGSLPKIKQVYAGGSFYGHSATLDEDDNLWTWGYNYYGQLGHGDTDNKTAPLEPTTKPMDLANFSTFWL